MTIEVSDRRGKYPTRTYVVADTLPFLAYGTATQQYIKDVGHPPYVRGKSFSAYVARFQNRVIK